MRTLEPIMTTTTTANATTAKPKRPLSPYYLGTGPSNWSGCLTIHGDGLRTYVRIRSYPPEWRQKSEQQLHRLDGPAVIHPDGRVEYWCEGVPVQQPSPHEDI